MDTKLLKKQISQTKDQLSNGLGSVTNVMIYQNQLAIMKALLEIIEKENEPTEGPC